jgi:hypothetical protein
MSSIAVGNRLARLVGMRAKCTIRIAAALFGTLMLVCMGARADAFFVWGNNSCVGTGFAITASGNIPFSSISRTHAHGTSATTGGFDDGLLILNIAGTVCTYTLTPVGSSLTLKADGSGTSTIVWTAFASNPASCGPSFTSHGAFMTQSDGSVGVGTDPGETGVVQCHFQ